MKNKTNLLIFICIVLLFFLFRPDLILTGGAELGVLYPDSYEFLEVTQALLGNTVRYQETLNSYVSGVELRTPGYPLVLAPFLLLPIDNLVTKVFIAHIVTWCITSLLMLVAFRREISKLRLLLSFVLSSFCMQVYSQMLLNEWTLFLTLILNVGCCFNFIKASSDKNLIYFGLSTTFCVLVKPDYAFLMLLFLTTALWTRTKWKSTLMIIFFTFVPIFIWLGFNLYRFQRLTLAPMEGFSILITTQLGKVEVSPSDPPKLVEFIKLMNEQGKRLEISELISLAWTGSETLNRTCDHNLKLAMNYQKERNLVWESMNEILIIYSKRAIGQFPGRYLLIWVLGVCSLLWTLPLILLMVKMILSIRDSAPLKKAVIYAILVHIVHVCFVAAIKVIDWRYYLPSLCVLLFSFFLLIAYMLEQNNQLPQKGKEVSL